MAIYIEKRGDDLWATRITEGDVDGQYERLTVRPTFDGRGSTILYIIYDRPYEVQSLASGRFDGTTITLGEQDLREIGLAQYFILRELIAAAVNWVNDQPNRAILREHFGWKP